jgi:hypothetical protein
MCVSSKQLALQPCIRGKQNRGVPLQNRGPHTSAKNRLIK